MATRKASVCYHSEIDMFDDEYAQPGYNGEVELAGFLTEGARELNDWHDADLPVVDERRASLKIRRFLQTSGRNI